MSYWTPELLKWIASKAHDDKPGLRFGRDNNFLASLADPMGRFNPATHLTNADPRAMNDRINARPPHPDGMLINGRWAVLRSGYGVIPATGRVSGMGAMAPHKGMLGGFLNGHPVWVSPKDILKYAPRPGTVWT